MENHTAFQSSLMLAGRILFSFIFLMSSVTKILGFNGTVMYMESAGMTSYTMPLAVLSIVFELGGGLLILLGWQTRLGATMLATFTAATAFGIHHYWSYPADQAYMQMIHFMKNIALTGGALYILSAGAGRFSVDGWFGKKTII